MSIILAILGLGITLTASWHESPIFIIIGILISGIAIAISQVEGN